MRQRFLRWSGAIAVAVVVAAVAAPLRTWADSGPAGLDDGDLIHVPLRWCAISGSPAVSNPNIVGEPDTDNVLWRRHERASNDAWIPGAGITFRSAMTAAVMTNADFPVIADPFPPASGGPGVEGDILDQQFQDPRDGSFGREVKEARVACDAAWSALEAAVGTNLEGPVALNAFHYVGLNGKPGPLIGDSSFSLQAMGTFAQMCDQFKNATPNLSFITDIGRAFIVVQDNSIGFTPNGSDHLVAHELGHVLYTGHGNGLDDDADQYFDACDGQYQNVSPPAEDPLAAPPTLMSPNGGNSMLINALQRRTARAIALRISGASFDPPGALVSVDVTRDHRTDRPHDVRAGFNDLVSAAVARQASATELSHEVFGLINQKAQANADYSMFVDLDNDASTGGRPSDLGFDTKFEGAELVTRVAVRTQDGPVLATPTVWRYRDGAFASVKDDGVTASALDNQMAEANALLSSAVTIRLPRGIFEPLGSQVRIEALADATAFRGELDRLPDDNEKGGGAIRLVPPKYPVCLTDGPHQPGEKVTVEATGMPSGQPLKVVLGDQLVGSTESDRKGAAKFSFTTDSSEQRGRRLVTIGVRDTAITADCDLVLGDEGQDGGHSSPHSTWGWWVAWLVLVLLLLLLAVLVFVWWRRRRARHAL